MKSLKRLFAYIKPYWKQMVGSILCMLLVTITYSSIIWMIQHFMKPILSDAQATSLRLHQLFLAALAILGLTIFKGLSFYGQTYLTNFVGQKVTMDLRNRLFGHLQRLSLSFFERTQTGSLISRVTNDVSVLQNILTSGIGDLITGPLTVLIMLSFMFVISWKLSLLAIVCLPLIIHGINRAGQKIRRITTEIQQKIAQVTSILQETITGIKIVQSFTREDYEKDRFEKETQASFLATLRGAKVRAILLPLVDILSIFGLVLALFYGGYEVIQGDLSSERLLTFLGCVLVIGTNFSKVSGVHLIVQQASAATQRLLEILDVESEIEESPEAFPLPEIRGEVEFSGVSFRYDGGELALNKVSLKVKPGEVVALVGPSGAGKSTLVSLIPRFYDPTEGEVLIDGYNVKKVTLSSLRGQIGIVPQETILFSGTIKENILYGNPEASDEEVIEAAKSANAHQFIMGLPEKYNTLVGERGLKLSGGERQRIAIARALLKDPRILIFDEATSSLDVESESLIQEALERLMKGRTTFIIAHRLSTIRRADKILVLDNGRIVEEGTHLQLLRKNGAYKRLYEAQFREGDLASEVELVG